MAIKPTIFKAKIDWSNLDNHIYESLDLTIAQHPSESTERMWVRILSFCLNYDENLSFSRGLSNVDEPAIWQKSLDDQIELWLDVGEPAPDRIKKASRISKALKIYSFNSKSSVWWDQNREILSGFNIEVWQFDWNEIVSSCAFVDRTMQFSASFSEGSFFLADDSAQFEVKVKKLFPS